MRLTDTRLPLRVSLLDLDMKFSPIFSLFRVDLPVEFQDPLSPMRFPGQGTPEFWNGGTIRGAYDRYRLLINRRKITGCTVGLVKSYFYIDRYIYIYIYRSSIVKILYLRLQQSNRWSCRVYRTSLLTNGRIKRIFMETGSSYPFCRRFFFPRVAIVTGSIFLINPLSSDYFQIYFTRTMFSQNL